jgi:hypothetical protein
MYLTSDEIAAIQAVVKRKMVVIADLAAIYGVPYHNFWKYLNGEIPATRGKRYLRYNQIILKEFGISIPDRGKK